jgi:hypothetical protein
MIRQLCFLSCFLIAVIAQPIAAGIYVPPGINQGDTYQLAFVTAGLHDALATDIEDYNAFVTAEAALNPNFTGTNEGIRYFVMGSTEFVNAEDNAVASADIYRFDGAQFATRDLWDEFSLHGGPFVSLSIDQFGRTTTIGHIYTGTHGEVGLGTATAAPLGTTDPLGPSLGAAFASDGRWIGWGEVGTRGVPRPLYALSSPITYVPEPLSTANWLVFLAWAWRMQKRPLFRRHE